MKKILLLLIAAFALTACTPEEIAWWESEATPIGCHEAVDRYWPSSSQGWAHRIVDRESGGDPTAQNSHSSAAGCMQLVRVHAHRYDATGSSWSMRYDARANIRAALNLYLEQGTRPWQ